MYCSGISCHSYNTLCEFSYCCNPDINRSRVQQSLSSTSAGFSWSSLDSPGFAGSLLAFAIVPAFGAGLSGSTALCAGRGHAWRREQLLQVQGSGTSESLADCPTNLIPRMQGEGIMTLKEVQRRQVLGKHALRTTAR